MTKRTSMQDEQFMEIISEHYQGIFRLCCRYFGNRDEASDATQDIVIRVWTNRKKFRGESSPATWMYRIATNVCLTSLQKRKLHNSISDLPDCDEMLYDTSDEEGERKAMDESKLLFFQRYMNSLNAADRMLVSLYLEEHDSKEIAAISGLTDNNVRTRLHRIKNQIKKEWEESHGTR